MLSEKSDAITYPGKDETVRKPGDLRTKLINTNNPFGTEKNSNSTKF